MAEISEVVRILCARMETNPEDFLFTGVGVHQTPKFYNIGESLRLRIMNTNLKDLHEHELSDYYHTWHYTEEELVLLKDAYYTMYRKRKAFETLDILFNNEEREKSTEHIAKQLAQSMHGYGISPNQNGVNSVLQPGFSMSNTTATGIHMANQLYSASGVTNGNK